MILEFLLDYGLFLAKVVTFVVAVIALFVGIKVLGGKGGHAKGELQITDLSEKHTETVAQLEEHLHDEAYLKARHKAQEKRAKRKEQKRGKRREKSRKIR